MVVNITETGAKGDGVFDNTGAIRKAVDIIKDAGGGRIIIPPGIYLAGTVDLCSHLELHLESGAVLKAIPDIAAFPRDSNPNAKTLNHYFLRINKAEDIVISGSGTIDGSGPSFWHREYYNPELPPLADTEDAPDKVEVPVFLYNVLKPQDDRVAVIYATDSREITIRDIKIKDASAFTVWLIGCEEITIHNIHVHNRRSGPNTDVLDIDCSRRVRISDCSISAGDDCIALKSDPHRTGTPFACEDITVTNCVLSSSTCAIRIGYEGDAPIRDCVFTNLVLTDCRHGIDMVSIAPVCPTLTIEHGTPIERIIFSNIVMRNAGQAIFVWAGNEYPRDTYAGFIRDIRFSGICADCVSTSWIGSAIPGAIRDISFEDVKITTAEWLAAAAEPDPLAIPSHWGGPWKAGALILNGISAFNASRFRCQVTNTGTPAIRWANMKDSEINGSRIPESGEAERI